MSAIVDRGNYRDTRPAVDDIADIDGNALRGLVIGLLIMAATAALIAGTVYGCAWVMA